MATKVIFHWRDELSELITAFSGLVEQMENRGNDWTRQVMMLTDRIVTIPVFLQLIEQIGVKIGYGKVMILSTCRMNCCN